MLLSFRSSFDVITLGAAVQDTFLRSASLEEVKNAAAPDGFNVCIPFGAKLDVQDYHVLSGGGATNAAVTFARSGLKTACICRVGQDRIGSSIVDELKKEGISTRFVQHDSKHNTGASVVLLSGSGHRAILTHRGAAAHLAESSIPWSRIKARWLYITSVGGDLDLIKHTVAHAKKHHIRVAWNPGKLELEEGLRKLMPLLKQIDVLLVNREEAALVTDLPPRHLGQIFKKLSRYPAFATAITDGQKGAYVQYESKIFFAPSLSGERVNTTGAGDAFGSGFVNGLAHNLPVDESLQAAVLNATSVVFHMGPKTGILKRFPHAKDRAHVPISRPKLS